MDSGQIYLIDKPKDWTSFDVVAKVRSELKQQANIKGRTAKSPRLRVGHAGTLDPFATGLLIILTGDATKQQAEFMKLDKTYTATFFLGSRSSTDDKTGKIITDTHQLQITKDDIEKTIKKFIGKIEQVPPKYSAIKVAGKRAYKLARKDETFELKPRTVTVYKFKIDSYKFPRLTATISCSSGTYIRSIARDIGELLGCGSYVESLRRDSIGNYHLAGAVKITDLFHEISIEK